MVRDHQGVLSDLGQRQNLTDDVSQESYLVNGDRDLSCNLFGGGFPTQPRSQCISGTLEVAAPPSCLPRADQSNSGCVEHRTPDPDPGVPIEGNPGLLVEPTAGLYQPEQTGCSQVLPIDVSREAGHQLEQDTIHQVKVAHHQGVTHRRIHSLAGTNAPDSTRTSQLATRPGVQELKAKSPGIGGSPRRL